MSVESVEPAEKSSVDEKLDRLLSRFAMAARAHNDAMESMDEEGSNTHARMVALLYERLVSTDATGEEKLLTLLDSDNPVVAGMAAVYGIRLNPERCLATLRRVAEEPGLLGFRASQAIERWESGEWEQ